MKKRSIGVMLTVAIVLVLSLAIVASASAAYGDPYLTSVSPTSMSTDTYGAQDLIIYGGNFDFDYDPSIALYQTGPPYDVIYASYQWTGTDALYCTIDPSFQSVGTYTVEVSGFWRLGQVVEDTITLPNAFRITGSTPAPSSPVIASISPNTKQAGSPAFVLSVYGYSFGSGIGTTSAILWNDQALPTTYVSSQELAASVPASYIAAAGTATVRVRNTTATFPTTTTTSGYAAFTITAMQPTLTGISPTTTWVNYRTPPSVTLSGTNFQSTAQVLVNGVVHASTFGSATQMTVPLSAADIASAGTLNISVRNTTSGTPTGAQAFTVNAENSMPVTTISGADALWHNQPVTLTISATDSQSGVWKTMFGIGTSMPWTQLTGSTLTVPGPMGGDPNGTNVVSAYSIDNCNANENPPVQATVNICTTGPSTDAFAPSQVKKGKNLKLSYDTESITPTCTITLKIYKSANGAVAKTINIGQKNSNKTYSYTFTCNLAPGKYKVKTFAVDAAGNDQANQTIDSFQVVK